MNPILISAGGKLTGDLAAGVISKLKQVALGKPQQQALERCIQAGLVALMARVTAGQGDDGDDHLAGIFDAFFHLPEVWSEIARMLRDRPLDHERLADIFDDHFKRSDFPDLDLKGAFDAFAAAFLEAADYQPELEGVIQTAQLRQQLSTQRELLAEMKQLAAALQGLTAVSVQRGQVLAEGSERPIYRWRIGQYVAGNVIGGSQYEMSGDFRQATIHIVNQFGVDQGTNPDKTLRPYLETVVRRCGRLPLGPLNPGGHDTAHLALLKVFINLDCGEKLINADGTLRHFSSAIAHANENERLIILGDPGSGKSTLFRFLAFCLASHQLEPDRQWLGHLTWFEDQIPIPPDEDAAAHWAKFMEQQRFREPRLFADDPGREREEATHKPVTRHWTGATVIPIQVELRNFAQTGFDPQSPVALWRFVSEQLEKDDLPMVIPGLTSAAQRGDVLFLFDGVDEVPVAKRPDVWRAIAALAKGPYGGCRWLAACRVLSFVPREVPSADPVQTLSPLNQEQIDSFVDNWYTALTEAGERIIPRSAESLRAASRRPRLRAVARNPMLLTIMALVQTYYGTLPEERARLYQQCVETLLLRWQRHKEDDDQEMPSLLAELGTNQQELERLLWEIAWEAHSQGLSQAANGDDDQAADIPEHVVMDIARSALGSWTRAEQFVEYTERRAHLLLGRGGAGERYFTFPHRTFQEYLAACHLASDRRPGEKAADLASQGDYWREVLNLTAGTLVFNQNNREKALDAIERMLPLSPPAPDDIGGWRCVWLAGEMTDVVGRDTAERDQTGQRFLPRLREYLATLVSDGHLSPVQRAAAGVALGRLGDPRFDGYLDVPEMVTIPAGPFRMGSDKKDKSSPAITMNWLSMMKSRVTK
jgi:energy-coupling factor transporter ATP-binding protein EcfA2